MKTEAELIALATAGDEQAFAQLIRPLQPMILRVAGRLVRNPMDAEDIAQNALVRVWTHLASYDPARGATFSTWVGIITSRLAFNVLRDGIRRRQRDMLVIDDCFDLAGDPRMEPDRLAHGREINARLQSALARIAPINAQVFVLREFEGETYEGIAERTHTNLGTVKSRLNRARTALAAHLAEVAA